ncbi:hypothetical protein NPIL_618831 [Nephila pilipes]|uniref:Uncharacterized protein n=1 Tax=Nephila pilipes TaxID=299642 RepID=A0A8X6TXZ9_NEPPI|nr:hypothetical protein NPIL_618831 [Nephila pilipes]
MRKLAVSDPFSSEECISDPIREYNALRRSLLQRDHAQKVLHRDATVFCSPPCFSPGTNQPMGIVDWMRATVFSSSHDMSHKSNKVYYTGLTICPRSTSQFPPQSRANS